MTSQPDTDDAVRTAFERLLRLNELRSSTRESLAHAGTSEQSHPVARFCPSALLPDGDPPRD